MKPMTTTNRRASRAGEISTILDQAIAALTVLDATKLESIEGHVAELVADGGRSNFAVEQAEWQAELREVASRHRLLGTLLATTDLNLAALGRLHSRHTIGETTWVR